MGWPTGWLDADGAEGAVRVDVIGTRPHVDPGGCRFPTGRVDVAEGVVRVDVICTRPRTGTRAGVGATGRLDADIAMGLVQLDVIGPPGRARAPERVSVPPVGSTPTSPWAWSRWT